MYKIIRTDGALLGIVDKPIYIKYGASGCFTNAKNEREAIGVALNSTPYNLMGHESIEGAETVMVNEVDGGAIVFEQGGVQEDTRLAIAELAEVMDAQNTANQLAIAEAVEALIGGE